MATVDRRALARISAALIAAATEAQAMVEVGDLGPALVELIQHANEMHELLLEELGAAGDHASETSRRLARVMGIKLAALRELLRFGFAVH